MLFGRRSERTKKSAEVVAFKLLTSAFPLLKLRKEHRHHVLQSCSPLLLGDGGINESFFTLFSIKKKKQSPNNDHNVVEAPNDPNTCFNVTRTVIQFHHL